MASGAGERVAGRGVVARRAGEGVWPGGPGFPEPTSPGVACCQCPGRVGCHRRPHPTSLVVGLVSGIEMEIVNSCEANNGGCSHGCSHSSTGPLCSCPRGYELDEDQKTCVGASGPLPMPLAPDQGLRAAPSGAWPDVTMQKLPALTPNTAPGRGAGEGGQRGPR